MTPQRRPQASRGAVEAARALKVDDGPEAYDARLGGPPAAPPANPGADQCVECGRTVNLAEPVSHGLRGSHTCHTVAGAVPPYLDPVTDAERGALLEYQHRRAAQRREDLTLDPTRPF